MWFSSTYILTRSVRQSVVTKQSGKISWTFISGCSDKIICLASSNDSPTKLLHEELTQQQFYPSAHYTRTSLEEPERVGVTASSRSPQKSRMDVFICLNKLFIILQEASIISLQEYIERQALKVCFLKRKNTSQKIRLQAKVVLSYITLKQYEKASLSSAEYRSNTIHIYFSLNTRQVCVGAIILQMAIDLLICKNMMNQLEIFALDNLTNCYNMSAIGCYICFQGIDFSNCTFQNFTANFASPPLLTLGLQQCAQICCGITQTYQNSSQNVELFECAANSFPSTAIPVIIALICLMLSCFGFSVSLCIYEESTSRIKKVLRRTGADTVFMIPYLNGFQMSTFIIMLYYVFADLQQPSKKKPLQTERELQLQEKSQSQQKQEIQLKKNKNQLQNESLIYSEEIVVDIEKNPKQTNAKSSKFNFFEESSQDNLTSIDKPSQFDEIEEPPSLKKIKTRKTSKNFSSYRNRRRSEVYYQEQEGDSQIQESQIKLQQKIQQFPQKIENDEAIFEDSQVFKNISLAEQCEKRSTKKKPFFKKKT